MGRPRKELPPDTPELQKPEYDLYDYTELLRVRGWVAVTEMVPTLQEAYQLMRYHARDGRDSFVVIGIGTKEFMGCLGRVPQRKLDPDFYLSWRGVLTLNP